LIATLPAAYRFDRCEVRPAERQVLVDGKPVTLGARAFDLLMALIEHRERVVTKNELLDLVWPGLVVEENNLQVQVSSLRKWLGQRTITTIPGRGYRFSASLGEALAAARPIEPEPAAHEPQLAAPPAASDNLPAALPPLYGRAADLASVRALVLGARLVTVIGAGGIGKTRLAQSVANDLRGEFHDGVWMVELAPVADAALVPMAVAQALRIVLPGGATAQQQLIGRLRSESLLLVLDNCEHLIDAVSRLVDALMREAPGVRVLATSQHALKLPSEQLVRLGTLAVPDVMPPGDAAAHGAVELFVQRVSALQAGFVLDQHNVDAVIAICRELDGVALALELAAARVPLLGVRGVRDHLRERFRMLTNGSRVAVPRHQTLRAALDWSHALLSADEQTVFRRLGVFVGGFSLELAQRVSSDGTIDAWAVLDLLGALVDKSMVVADASEMPRYRLLESARAYALERLAAAGEEPAVRRRHAEGLLAELDRLVTPTQAGLATVDESVRVLGPEVDNLRTAVEWAGSPEGDTLLAIGLLDVASSLMYQLGQYPECVGWMLRLEPRVDDTIPLELASRFRFGLALVSLHGGLGTDRRQVLLERALAGFLQLGLAHMAAHALTAMTHVAIMRGDFAAAQARIEQARELIGPQAPHYLRALNLYMQGMVYRYAQRWPEAVQAFTQALGPAQRGGDLRNVFYVFNNLAAVYLEMGEVDQAVAHHRATLDLARGPRFDSQMSGFSLAWLARALTVKGSLAEAQSVFEQALPHLRRTVGVRHFCGYIAELAAQQGRLADAARLIGCDDAGLAQRGVARSPQDARTLQATLALIGAAHPAAQIEAWRAEGGPMGEDDVAALVRAGGAQAESA